MSIYDYSFKNNAGETVEMSQFKNSVTLVVNVASRCGFTNQYTGLQALHDKFKDEGFNVIGFPCNQFGSQEPGSDAEIKEFCSTFNVTFHLASKIDVNGEFEDPIYTYLKKAAKNGNNINWNFEKFLILKDGSVLNFEPNVEPESLESLIAEKLGK